MENKFNPNAEIKEFIKKHKDEFLLDYSKNILESYAEKLLELIKKWESKEKKMIEEIYFTKHKIKNFQSDFTDELPNNYDNKKRDHRQKWSVQKEIIDNLKVEFLGIYDEFQNE